MNVKNYKKSELLTGCSVLFVVLKIISPQGDSSEKLNDTNMFKVFEYVN